MKLGIYKFSMLFGLFMVSAALMAGDPPSKEFSKVIIKEFKLSDGQSVALNNQYGQIHVEPWDQEAVKIKIEIVVEARAEADAEDVYKRIKFAFEESNRGVSCTTNVENNSGGFWDWWGSNGASEYSINYDVKMPASAALAVSNKYGDCTIHNIVGNCDYNIKYGNLYAYGDIENVDLSVGYGKVKMEGVRTLNASLEYATLKCKSTESCNLNSKYSNVFLEDAGELVCSTKYDDYHLGSIGTFRNNGKYDDFHIAEVSDIQMQTSYADLEIGKLHHFAKLQFQYGEVDILELHNTFRTVQIEGSYADFRINTSAVENFDISVDGNYSDIDCRRRLNGVDEEKEGSKYKLAGYVSQSGAGGDIVARVTYGSVQIK